MCLYTRATIYVPSRRPSASLVYVPALRGRYTRFASHTVLHGRSATRRQREKKIEDPSVEYGSRAPLFGFSCARGSARGAEGKGCYFCLCLSFRRGEGAALSPRETLETLLNAISDGPGENGEGKGRARMWPTGSSVMPAFATRRGEPEWAVPGVDWTRETSGARDIGGASRTLPIARSRREFFIPLFTPRTEKTVPYIPPALPADRGISLAPGWRALSVPFARALPVRRSAQERTLSFWDPLE